MTISSEEVESLIRHHPSDIEEPLENKAEFDCVMTRITADRQNIIIKGALGEMTKATLIEFIEFYVAHGATNILFERAPGHKMPFAILRTDEPFKLWWQIDFMNRELLIALVAKWKDIDPATLKVVSTDDLLRQFNTIKARLGGDYISS